MEEKVKGQETNKADYRIVVDSREKNPLWTNPNKVIVKGLSTGDYSIEGLEDEIAIERKDASDLFGTLTSGHKRFKKELERAEKLQYFGVVIEGNYTSILNKDFDGSWNIKVKGFVVTSILFTIHVKYKVPFFFCNDRHESKRVIRELFNAYFKIHNAKSKLLQKQKI